MKNIMHSKHGSHTLAMWIGCAMYYLVQCTTCLWPTWEDTHTYTHKHPENDWSNSSSIRFSLWPSYSIIAKRLPLKYQIVWDIQDWLHDYTFTDGVCLELRMDILMERISWCRFADAECLFRRFVSQDHIKLCRTFTPA